MKTQKLLIIAIFSCLAVSVAATLATYNVYYEDTHITGTALLHRGWPLHWIIESIPLWDFWPQSSRATLYYFQPQNFFADILFWTLVFTTPTILLILAKAKK